MITQPTLTKKIWVFKLLLQTFSLPIILWNFNYFSEKETSVCKIRRSKMCYRNTVHLAKLFRVVFRCNFAVSFQFSMNCLQVAIRHTRIQNKFKISAKTRQKLTYIYVRVELEFALQRAYIFIWHNLCLCLLFCLYIESDG